MCWRGCRPIVRGGTIRAGRAERACRPSNKLTDVLAKDQSLKRRDFSTIQPEQGRLVRADDLFRRAPFFGSLLRHGDHVLAPISGTSEIEVRSRAYVRNMSRTELCKQSRVVFDYPREITRCIRLMNF